jgi:elongation factor G
MSVNIFSAEKIRNIGIIGHGSTGKTTLSEALLFSMGGITRMGTVVDGNTQSDYHQTEIDRKISIYATLLYGQWKDNKINMIDTPGFSDFYGEVKGAVRVVDSAVVVVDANAGVDVGTELVWEFADEFKLSKVIFINKLNKEHVNFNSVIDSLQEAFKIGIIPIQFPVTTGEGFNTVIDILMMKQISFASGTGKMQVQDIPEAHKSRAIELREKLVELAAESDDQLLEIFFDKGELTPEQFEQGFRNGVVSGHIVPVLCGAADQNLGTHRLLDVIVSFAPSPLNRPPATGKVPDSIEELTRECNPTAPTSALVFKTLSEAHLGELSFFRVYSGKVQSGSDLRNPNRNQTEKMGQIFLMNSRERKNVDHITAGDIGAAVKLKNTYTGDTLCDPKAPVVLPEITFPTPVIRTALVPAAKGDEERIGMGLNVLRAEDPSFSATMDAELGQIIVAGQGELHLTTIIDRLKERFGVSVTQEEPNIPYRETIKGAAEAEGKHKKQSGGRGQFGIVNIKMEPLPRGSEDPLDFVDAIVGGAIPGKFIPAVEKGIREAMTKGVIAGFPVVDVRVTLFDGKFHDVDSSEMAFKIAGSLGFKNAFKDSKPVILEPIYDVEVKVPQEYMGDIMGDLSSRRGKIQGMDSEGRFQVIRAKVPLAEIHKYANDLRSMTQGRATHRRKFSHYEEVPREIQEKLVAKYDAKREEGY